MNPLSVYDKIHTSSQSVLVNMAPLLGRFDVARDGGPSLRCVLAAGESRIAGALRFADLLFGATCETHRVGIPFGGIGMEGQWSPLSDQSR
jgi:hypothetical protein